MNSNLQQLIPALLLFCTAANALWTPKDAVSNGKEVVGAMKKVDPIKKSLTDSHNGIIQTPEQASKPFNCSAIPVSNKLFNLSALNQDWKVVSDTDAILLNPCGSLRYSNSFCPAGQTSLCLLEKTGGKGIASFGTVSKTLLSPKGIHTDLLVRRTSVVVYE